MNAGTKTALATGGGLLGGALVGFLLVRRKVLQRCRAKVKGACKDLPLVPDAVCDDMAKGICVGAKDPKDKGILTTDQPARGARRRRGVSHVSVGNRMAGEIGRTRR